MTIEFTNKLTEEEISFTWFTYSLIIDYIITFYKIKDQEVPHIIQKLKHTTNEGEITVDEVRRLYTLLYEEIVVPEGDVGKYFKNFCKLIGHANIVNSSIIIS